ncbi:MAG: alpha/beta hydrolase [Lachnospiraceae bacterium]
MQEQHVVFLNNTLHLRLAGILRLPDAFDLNKNYPAVVVAGPMLSLKEQAQSTYAERLTEAGYVTLVYDGSYFGESQGTPRQLELPSVKETDIEGAAAFLKSLPFVDPDRIGGLGICGGGSYMSVAGVKADGLRAIAAIVPAISDISKSPMMGFFRPAGEVEKEKKAFEAGTGKITYLNFMPRDFAEGAAYYYTSRGNRKGYDNRTVAWSELELASYNVPAIMKDMKKPYLVISGEKAWSRPASTEVFDAVPGSDKKMVVIPEAGHFDLYDLDPYVTEAFDQILPFFAEKL